jgi:hexosaminidase
MKVIFLCMSMAYLVAATACSGQTKSSRSDVPGIIPEPVKIEKGKGGHFTFTPKTIISVPGAQDELMKVARYLGELLRPATGLDLPVEISNPKGQSITFELDGQTPFEEGYHLSVNAQRIQIRARTAQGAFYAVQSLRQLLPAEIEQRQTTSLAIWKVPAVEIEDTPRYPYRGMHLDVCRHFFSLTFVKKYLDLMAMHKMNRFHWHLTDDQGWRIEIKKYPRLQQVAAFRNETLIGHYSDKPHQFDGKRYGGYYTQEEIKEIVQYAADRFITVIPEIEMPGHALAAIAAYPELSCTGKQTTPATLWGVFDDVFCPKDETFLFLEDILTEVMTLFPGKYIHIGGDECPKTRWKACRQCQSRIKSEGLKDEYELQSYFARRIEQFLNEHGRSIIGWDEILEGGLAPNATVMSWQGTKGGIEAARQRHDVIMTPGSHCYFDYYQSVSPDEPLAIGGFTSVERAYSFEPTPPELTASEARHILGAQGNLWTEYIPTPAQAEYMAYPRAIALAEVVWSPKEKRDYADFAERLSQHMKRLDVLGVNYANHIFDIYPSIEGKRKGLRVQLLSRAANSEIRFEMNGSVPSAASRLYRKPLLLRESQEIKAAVFKNGQRTGRIQTFDFRMHKAAGKLVSLTKPPHPNYNAGGAAALTNSFVGSDQRYGDGEWLGWSGDDFEGVIDLGKVQALSRVSLRFFDGNGQWIYLPRRVEILTSTDGKEYVPGGEVDSILPSGKVATVNVSLKNTQTRFLKIRVQRYGTIAEGMPGAGHEAWLFVDEITVD